MKKNYNQADAEWEWYIGQLYSKLIKNLFIKRINCVVELAPGFRHKIADALKELDFKGTIYVIDNSSDVLTYVKKKYKEIIPEAKIICIDKSFKDSIKYLPKKIDLFLSNHSIDDLIISDYSKEKYSMNTNNETLNNRLLKLWEQLYNDHSSIKEITNEVYDSFKELFKRKNIELVVMSQYQSNSYFLGRNNYMNKIVDKCFNKIKKLTNTADKRINKLLDFYPFGIEDERYNGKYLINNTQNAKNWIAGAIKKEL